MNEDGEYEDLQDEGFYMDSEEPDFGSDLGWDPYAGTYVDDAPLDLYEEVGFDHGDFTDGPDYD